MKKALLLVMILLILPAVHAANIKLEVYLDGFIYLGSTYTKLFRITNLDHKSGQTDCINLTLGYSISNITAESEITCLNSWKTAGTGEFTPAETGTFGLCGWIINTTAAACKNITVLNQGQEPPEPEIMQEKQTESEIKIIKVAGNAKFGQAVDVKLMVYRGDTGKYAVYAEIGDISRKTTMHFTEKFINYTLTIPVQLKPNCDEKYPDGKYRLDVYGLGTSDSEKIIISGLTSSMCSTEKIVIEKNITSEKQCQNQTIQPITNLESIRCLYQSYKKPKIIYESSSAKASELAPALIIAVLSALAAILIWRR